MKKTWIIVLLFLASFTLISCESDGTANKIYDVNFYINEDIFYLKDFVTENNLLTQPATPTYEDEVFEYWTLDGTKFSFDTKITNTLDLYAKWEGLEAVVPTERVSVMIYDGQEHLEDINVIKDSNVTDIIFERTGYKFISWYYNEELTESVNTDDIITDDLVLFGKWEVVENTLLAYYENRGIENATGQQLRDLLKERLFEGVNIKSYGGSLNDPLRDADEYAADKSLVNIIYDTDYMKKTANGSSGSNEWNKEHVIPRSWFVNDYGRHLGDLHNLRISRASTNSARGNLKFADGSGGWAKTGGGFYPGDGHQGDSARIALYMMVMLPDALPISKVVAGSNGIEVLRKWHYEDPVDEFEIRRNNVLFGYQGNRNPFIDNPEFFDLIWGSSSLSNTVEIEEKDPLDFNLFIFNNQRLYA